MNSSKDRNLNLGDGLILVAATAAGIRLVPEGIGDSLTVAISAGDNGLILFYMLAMVVPTWLAWTFAVAAIALRPPRPRLRRLASRPGLVAGLAAALTSTVPLAFALIAEARLGWSSRPIFSPNTLVRLPDYLGPSVVGAWLALRLTGRWRPDPGLIDRLGRWLGVGWIAFPLALLVFTIVF